MKRFNRRSTAEQVTEGIDLTGKNALVTGANTGLGMETTRVLALRGARVTMACRDMEKAELARREIRLGAGRAIGKEQLDLLHLDLNSLERTREAAEEFCSWQRPLHLLINNAGIMIPIKRVTRDGFEAHVGVNHLGHFLFTNLLLGPLLQAGAARVVVLSSAAMGFATLGRKLEDLNWERRKFRGFPSYGDSKLMNLMFAREFNRRYGEQGIVANALHPGVISTDLAREQTVPVLLLGILGIPFMKSIPQGAATTLLVATSPDYETRGGLYFSNCAEAKPQHRLARDDAMAEAVWEWSEKMTGLPGNE